MDQEQQLIRQMKGDLKSLATLVKDMNENTIRANIPAVVPEMVLRGKQSLKSFEQRLEEWAALHNQ